MKEINVDGKMYVLKTDIPQEKATLKFTKEIFTSDDHFFGVGSAKLSGEWFVTKLNLDYLVSLIKVLQGIDKQHGLKTVHILTSKDNPMIIGKVNQKQNTVQGFFLAHRTED